MDSSVKMGLALPTTVDPFQTADVRANFEKIDASPGTFICTSTTRPTWTSAHAGRKIYETNTGLEWVWDGAAFRRLSGSGLLKRSDGSWAIGERTTTASTSSTTFVVAVAVTSVVIPDGNRPIRVDVSWVNMSHPSAQSAIAIYRSNTNASGPYQGGRYVESSAGDGGSFFTIERDGLAPGVYNFSLQFRSRVAGTTSIVASASEPISIFVSEM